jgi:hypothetical protein
MAKGYIFKPVGTPMLTLFLVFIFIIVALTIGLGYAAGYFKSNQVTGCSSMISCIVAMIKYYIGMKG